MSLHSFDPQVASSVGVNAAVIYQNILFWTKKNLANGRHVHDGMVWTYNSVKALNELFDYLTPDQIRRAIQKLIDAGLIAEGNYNASAYDRTKWYGVFAEVHLAKTPNGSGENHKPIPDSKPDSKPDQLGTSQAKPKKRKPELPLPDGWVPDIEKARRVMDEYNLNRDEMNFCYKAMEGHAHANDRRQRDWDAAYRNWVIREIGYGNIGPGSKRRKQSASQSSIWD